MDIDHLIPEIIRQSQNFSIRGHFFANNIFAWDSLTFTKYFPIIAAGIANNNKNKKEEQKQKIQQYQTQIFLSHQQNVS